MTRARLICCLLIGIGIGGFVYRTVLRAYVDTRNDLSDPYCASWLWLHGQNPYDVRLATQVSAQQIHSEMRLVPVYPPSAYAVVAPLSLLPWKPANLVWALLGLFVVAGMAYLLPEIGGMSWREDRAWWLAASVFCAAPLHTALHAANSAAIVICLCLVAVYLARADRGVWAGVVAAVAVCLKPQLGIWVLVFYLVRRRWSLVLTGSVLVALATAIAVFRMPIAPIAFWQSYTSNLHYWFDPGKMNDFSTANHFRFELVNAQVLLQPLLHSSTAANVIAWVAFAGGLVVWTKTMLRRLVVEDSLGFASLMMLSMIPVYHRSYDAAIALLSVTWILRTFKRPVGLAFYAVLVPTCALLAPAPSAILEAISYRQPGLRDLASSSVLAVYSSLAMILLGFGLLYRLAISRQEEVCIPIVEIGSVSNSAQRHARSPEVLVQQS